MRFGVDSDTLRSPQIPLPYHPTILPSYHPQSATLPTPLTVSGGSRAAAVSDESTTLRSRRTAFGFRMDSLEHVLEHVLDLWPARLILDAGVDVLFERRAADLESKRKGRLRAESEAHAFVAP